MTTGNGTTTTKADCCCTSNVKTPTLTDNEKARRSSHKTQGQIQFVEHLASRNECYKGKTSPGGDSLTSDERKALPIIDLFLNPRREAEKEDVLEMARKEEAGFNHTK